MHFAVVLVSSVGRRCRPTAAIDGACPAHFDPRLIAHIERTQVAWWDETSKKCVLDGAHTSLYHHRFKRNADGKLDSNGTLRERIACTVPKFQQRADLVLGVAVVEYNDNPGVEVGIRLKPVDYTGKWVYSDAAMDEERAKVWALAKKAKGAKRKFVIGQRPAAGEGVELFEEDDVGRIPKIGGKRAGDLLSNHGVKTVGQLKRRAEELSPSERKKLAGAAVGA